MFDYIRICEEAARLGGAELLAWLGRFEVREKGPADLVTQADLASQETIRHFILGQFPEHVVLGEEDPETAPQDAEFRWIVDPLDGTTNYVHSVPHFAVSIACQRQGEIIAGTVFDPVNKESYTAGRGRGAWLNGLPIHVSRVADLSEALLAASFSAKVDPKSVEIGQFVGALLHSQAVRRTGSAALNLCYVAAGRFDSFWALTTKAWDVAAGALLVEEAGGIVSTPDGQRLVIGNARLVPAAASATPELHRQFLALLAEHARSV